jgi:hypothetical protein
VARKAHIGCRHVDGRVERRREIIHSVSDPTRHTSVQKVLVRCAGSSCRRGAGGRRGRHARVCFDGSASTGAAPLSNEKALITVNGPSHMCVCERMKREPPIRWKGPRGEVSVITA